MRELKIFTSYRIWCVYWNEWKCLVVIKTFGMEFLLLCMRLLEEGDCIGICTRTLCSKIRWLEFEKAQQIVAIHLNDYHLFKLTFSWNWFWHVNRMWVTRSPSSQHFYFPFFSWIWIRTLGKNVHQF